MTRARSPGTGRVVPAHDRRPEVIDSFPRRKFIIGGVSLVALLAACGGESGPAPSTTGDAIEGSGFPVTVNHKYGSTTIPAKPQRVVTVSFTDPAFVLALGVEPVAITDWYGDYPLGVWPWAQDALGDAKPGVMPRPQGDKLNFELIAGFRPDLIIGQYTGMTREEYERASRLAPTVAQSGEHQSRFASVRREHPEFVGAPLLNRPTPIRDNTTRRQLLAPPLTSALDGNPTTAVMPR